MRSLVHILFYLRLWSCYLFSPLFFPVACLSIWEIFILHHFKDKRWNGAICILSNLAEYTGVPSNFVSRAHQGFVSQFKRTVSHHAADTKSVSRQLKTRCGAEKCILKKKKRKSPVIVWPQWQQITLAEKSHMGPMSVQDQIGSPWQQISGRGQCGRGQPGRSPMWSRDTLSHSPHCPRQAPQCWKCQFPKHLCSRLASQQASPNNSKEAINICIFSDASTVNIETVKAKLSRQHPAWWWLWCWARSSSVGTQACDSSSTWSQQDLDLWLRVKMQYCFTKPGSSLVIKAEQRSNISRAQNYRWKMTWIYYSISWGLSWKSRWISNYERKCMERSELLKTTVPNPKFSQNLKALLYCETVAFIIPLHCAGLAETAESWQQIYVVT